QQARIAKGGIGPSCGPSSRQCTSRTMAPKAPSQTRTKRQSPLATELDEAWEGRASYRPPSGEKHMPTGTIANVPLAQQLLESLDALFELHPGFRPAHAKGLMCSGVFTPSPEAAKLTRAPHASSPSTPVTVRYSNGTGLPNIPDNDPARSGPRGIAGRSHLGDHVHTDIIGHSTDCSPVRTGEEFLEFLRAAAAFGAGRPEALGAFLATHPNAKRFLEAPKPIPTSFAREAFFI